MSDGLPQWLRAALEERASGPYPDWAQGEWPVRPQPGEFRVLAPMERTGEPFRTVLVLDIDAETCTAEVALCSNETEVATDLDVRILSEESNLSFPIVVETDVVGPVWFVQLGPTIGRVSNDLVSALRAFPAGAPPEEVEVEVSPASVNLSGSAGLPTRDPADPLWQWKRSELRAFRSLAADCLATTFEDGEVPVVLDTDLLPSSSDFPITDAELPLLILGLVDWAHASSAVSLPLNVADRLLSSTEYLSVDYLLRQPLGLDLAHALQSVLLKAATEPALEPTPPIDVDWLPRRRSMEAPDPLHSVLSECRRRGSTCIRLVTSRSFWARTTWGGAMAAVVDARRVQVIPRFIENVGTPDEQRP